MAIAQEGQLALQRAATGIAAGVVVAKHTGHRQGQATEAGRNQLLAIAEVAHHHQGIGPQQIQELLIETIPLAVEITGNGDLQIPVRVRVMADAPVRIG
jgi:hypothetical protein